MQRMVIVGILAAVAGVASAQVPAGPEFRVNTFTGGQELPQGRSISMTASGDFVVVWETDQPGADFNIIGQRYDATGLPRGGEFLVNTYTTNLQRSAHVTVLGAAGDFVVAWNSIGPDGSGYGVFARRYDTAGTPVGAEFRVNTYTPGTQFIGGIAANPAGDFVVTWFSDAQDGSSRGAFARRFDRTATPLGAEFLVNTYTTGQQDVPFVDFDEEGRFVVVWRSLGQDGSSYGIFGQRYDAAGFPQGGEFRVNTYTPGGQDRPTVAADPAGNFVVAWQSAGQDGDSSGIFAQRYDASGGAVGSEFAVNNFTTGSQGRPGIATDSHGNFTVGWASSGGAAYDVQARRFATTGNPRGLEFRVNTFTAQNQINAGVAVDPVGNFVVAWGSYQQDGNSWGVFAQRFGGLGPAALAVDTAGNLVLEPGETVNVRPTWRNSNGAPQTFSGTLTNMTGPAGATYTIIDPMGSYGTVADGASAPCTDCYAVSVSNPPTRPATHWDASALETVVPDTQGQQKGWTLHIGGSFTDVPANNAFYRFIETVFHHGITGGCTSTEYCPNDPAIREQMAVFVLVAREGTGYVPPACTTPMFADVPASSPFCPWIEELARRSVVSGCGGGNYCPTSPVTREQMAVFVLRMLDPAINPPACVAPTIYNDVPASSPFCRWIEELTRRGVVTGCGGGNYCPTAPINRGQMAVFISVTFGLTLYGP